MSHTTRRPPDGRAVLLDLGREALLDLAVHPAGRAAAEWAVHALLGVLRACRTADELFARHNDRRLREADCAFVVSALPARLVARSTAPSGSWAWSSRSGRPRSYCAGGNCRWAVGAARPSPRRATSNCAPSSAPGGAAPDCRRPGLGQDEHARRADRLPRPGLPRPAAAGARLLLHAGRGRDAARPPRPAAGAGRHGGRRDDLPRFRSPRRRALGDRPRLRRPAPPGADERGRPGAPGRDDRRGAPGEPPPEHAMPARWSTRSAGCGSARGPGRRRATLALAEAYEAAAARRAARSTTPRCSRCRCGSSSTGRRSCAATATPIATSWSTSTRT